MKAIAETTNPVSRFHQMKQKMIAVSVNSFYQPGMVFSLRSFGGLIPTCTDKMSTGVGAQPASDNPHWVIHRCVQLFNRDTAIQGKHFQRHCTHKGVPVRTVYVGPR